MAIRTWTYPHSERSDKSDKRHRDMVELLETPEISEALDQKFELFYEVRKLEDICNGPVGRFTEFKTSELVSRCEHLEELLGFVKKVTINGTDMTVVTMDYRDLAKVIKAKAIQEKNQPECLFLRDNLMKINWAITTKKKEKTGTQIKITIPSKGLWNERCRKSENFIMFELIDTPPGDASNNAAIDTPPGDASNNVAIDTPPGDASNNVAIDTPPGDAINNVAIDTPPGDASNNVAIDTPPGDAINNVAIDTPPGDASNNAAVDNAAVEKDSGQGGISGVENTSNDVPDGRMPEVTDNESIQQAERAVEKRKGTRETAV